MMHEAIQRAYQGAALDDAVRETWEAACMPVIDELDELDTTPFKLGDDTTYLSIAATGAT